MEQKLNEILPHLGRWYAWLQENIIILLVTLIAAVVAGCLLLLAYWGAKKLMQKLLEVLQSLKNWWFFRKRGNTEMGKSPSKDSQKFMMAFIYTEAIEEAVFTNMLTVEQARIEYRKIAMSLGYWECMPRRFVPKPPHPSELKEAIRFRLQQSERGKVLLALKVTAVTPAKETSNAVSDLRQAMASAFRR